MYEDAELVRIAVSSFYRRLDIGYKMLDWLINEVRNNGAEKVFLDVRKSNEAAISLYEKIGFSSYEITEDFYNNPVEASVKMNLDLKGR